MFIWEYHDLQKIKINKDKLHIYNKYEIWSYCKSCHLLTPRNMLPNYGNQQYEYSKNCFCDNGQYSVSMVNICNVIEDTKHFCFGKIVNTLFPW